MGLLDSFWGIMLPFMAHASTIFFFSQYLLSIPKDIVDAGRVDGASEYGIFFRFIVPIMKPAFSAMAILGGHEQLEQLPLAHLVLRSGKKYVLSIGLNTLLTPYGNNYDILIAGACFSIIPLLILFFYSEVLHRRHDHGQCQRLMTLGGVLLVTISDVAKRAKVSRSTVSRVLNNQMHHIREETRQSSAQSRRGSSITSPTE
jgi:ABC-type Fe3+ transport system permease subunit